MTLTAQEKQPRLGFLGTGWIGRNRLEAVVKNNAAWVEAIADSDPELAKQASLSAAGSRIVEDYTQMLSAPVDGVVIATPSALHAEQAIAALKTGKAVFCQKPLGRNYEETLRVVETARAENKLLGVDFSYRHTCFRKVYDAICEGQIGEVFSVNLVFHNAYGPGKSWFYDPKLAGGGCVLDLGVHLVDLALWTLKNPEIRSVNSTLFSKGDKITGVTEKVEDFAVASIDTDKAKISLTCSWNASAGQDAVIEATFFGTKGGASFKNLNGSFYDFTAELYHGTSKEVLALPPDEWGGRAILDWTARLTHSSSFSEEAQTFVSVARVVDMIYNR